jgi:hypothetical protein
MGNCIIGESPYRVLRYSLPGALLPAEMDFRDFFNICTTETHKLISQIHITPTICFYVVVSGEVHVTISTKDKRPDIVSIALPGDMIFFFGTNVDATFVNGCMDFDGVRVGLQFRSSDGLAQVIGANYEPIQQFLNNRPYLNALRSLFDVKLETFLSSAGFLSLKMNQVSLIFFMRYNLIYQGTGSIFLSTVKGFGTNVAHSICQSWASITLCNAG